MKRVWILLAMPLFGCGPPEPPRAIARTDVAIVIRADGRNSMQSIEDLAAAHCRAHGLVARQTQRRTSGVIVGVLSDTPLLDFRYECQARPGA